MSDLQVIASNPPQYHDRSSTSRIMWTVVGVLVPAAGWGVYVFGADALSVLAVAILSALAAEALGARLAGRRTLADGSAFLTGLLVGMTLPPGVPLFVPAVASIFAILVVKWTFGGLGTNWMNPALAGRVFVAFSWPQYMSAWITPRALADATSAATPLGIVKAAQGSVGTPMAILAQAGYPHSSFDARATEWLNAHLLGPLGIDLPAGYVDPFVGNVAGSIGEVSALLLLAGTIVLFARRIITWRIPVSFFVTFALLTRIFGGTLHGQGLWNGDVLFSVLTGGFLLTLFYMATDTVTSPLTGAGMLIFGTGIGVLTFVLRSYGQFPEATALAVILMNLFVPMIDAATQPRRFGARRAPAGEMRGAS